jgi:predicted RNA-binding Zn-ribbon protein involved in translation (DUF1610 family)
MVEEPMSDPCPKCQSQNRTLVASAGGVRKVCDNCGYSVRMNLVLHKGAKQ